MFGNRLIWASLHDTLHKGKTQTSFNGLAKFYEKKKNLKAFEQFFFKNVPKTSGFLGKTKVLAKAYEEKKTWKTDMSQLFWKTDWVPIGRTLFPKKPWFRPNTHFCWLLNKNNELSSKVTGRKTCTKVVKEGFQKSFIWPILISCYAIISLHKPSRTCWRHNRSSCRRQYQKNEKAPLLRGSNSFSFFSYRRETLNLSPFFIETIGFFA